MRYRKLGPDGDYVFGGGQKDFWRDVPEAVAQSVLTRMLLWLGEWYLNTSEGTPYLQGILGKYSQTTADITIQDRVLSTDGVTDLSNYESIRDEDTRKLSATMTIDTVYGPTKLQVANYANY